MCCLRGVSEPQGGPLLSSHRVCSPAEFTSSCRPPEREDKLASLQNTKGLVIGYSSLGKFNEWDIPSVGMRGDGMGRTGAQEPLCLVNPQDVAKMP